MVKPVKNEVVKIYVSFAKFDWRAPYTTSRLRQATGTGFFINEKGLIITAAHVVEDAVGVIIEVPEKGREKYEADVLGLCPAFDIALLKVKNYKPKSWLKLGDSDKIETGEAAVAYGYPLGQTNLISTKGVVSGRYHSMLQMDVPINSGNSGGPLLYNGKVIGINVAALVGMGISATNYAVPINQYKLISDELQNRKQQLVIRPFFGLNFNNNTDAQQTLYKTPDGVVINKIFKGAPVNQTGIKVGDVLCSINGRQIDNYGLLDLIWLNSRYELRDYFILLPLNKPVKIEYWNGTKLVRASFQFTDFEPAIRDMYPVYETIDYEILGGLVLMNLSINHLKMFEDILDEYGFINNRDIQQVVISYVIPGSQADISGIFEEGDIIKTVNNKEVRNLQEMRTQLLKPINNKFIELITKNGERAVLDIQDIVVQNILISESSQIPLTKFHNKMMKLIK